jgi:beta-mannanase
MAAALLTGHANSVVNFYDTFDTNMFTTTVPEIWDTYHATPFLSLNTNSWTNQQIVSGAEDSNVAGWATSLKQWLTGTDSNGHAAPAGGRRIFIRLDWEANANWYPWSPTSSATTCAALAAQEALYVQMFRHVHDLVMRTGGFSSSQVAWVFSVNSVDAGAVQGCAGVVSNVTAYIFPGDAYVDWIGIDGYNSCASPATPTQLFGPMASELRGLSVRPLSIDEVGSSTNSSSSPGGYCTTTAQNGA